MNWLSTHRPSPSFAVAIAAMVIAIGGVAYATIPDSNGTINSCYQKSDGNLRVVESSGDCRSSEKSLSWNQQGGSASYPPGNANSTQPDPPANPTGTVVETHVSLSQSGRLLVTGSVNEETITCASGPDCFEQFGLYVDGVGVPGTRGRADLFTSGGGVVDNRFPDAQETLIGKSSVLPPGDHVVTLARKVTSGSATFPNTLASVDAVAIQP